MRCTSCIVVWVNMILHEVKMGIVSLWRRRIICWSFATFSEVTSEVVAWPRFCVLVFCDTKSLISVVEFPDHAILVSTSVTSAIYSSRLCLIICSPTLLRHIAKLPFLWIHCTYKLPSFPAIWKRGIEMVSRCWWHFCVSYCLVPKLWTAACSALRSDCLKLLESMQTFVLSV